MAGTLGIFAVRLSVTHSTTVASAIGAEDGLTFFGVSVTPEMIASLVAATVRPRPFSPSHLSLVASFCPCPPHPLTLRPVGRPSPPQLNTIFIGVFNSVYRRVGVMLTDWENHRTPSEYENSLILKNAIFQVGALHRAAPNPKAPDPGPDPTQNPWTLALTSRMTASKWASPHPTCTCLIRHACAGYALSLSSRPAPLLLP